MKVFDASVLIGIFDELKWPELIDHILKLGHDLAVPSYVFENELKSELTLAGVTKLVKQGKIKILPKNSLEVLLEFTKNSSINFGEADVLLSFQKLKTKDAYCILDEKAARSLAKTKKIKFTGLLGLLKLLRDREIITRDEYTDAVSLLKKSTFRMPSNYPDD